MLVTIAVMVAAAVVATGLARFEAARRRGAPTVARGQPPTSLDRGDFRSPDAYWLIAVFTSATCSSCAAVLAELRALENADIAVVDVEVATEPQLHAKYGVESVPTTVFADTHGNAKLAFVGPLGPDHRAAMAELLA